MKMPWEFGHNSPERMTAISDRRVASLLYNCGDKCYYCRQPFEFLPITLGRHPTRDHKMPKARGGERNRKNIVLACAACNHVKSDMNGGRISTFSISGAACSELHRMDHDETYCRR